MSEKMCLKLGAQSGGIKLIFLGTGTSFDVTQYNGYEGFTEDNFICEPVNRSSVGWGSATSGYNKYVPSARAKAFITKTYNASTGILSSRLEAHAQVKDDTWRSDHTSQTGSVKAYLVIT